VLPCVVNSRLHPRRTSRSRHCDANCVTASRLKSALTNCDACNSFRFCFYEICRVVLVFLTKDLHFNLHLAFPARALCALRPKSVSQLSCNQRVPHSFQKQPGGTTELGPFFGLQATGVAFGLSSFFSHSCALFAATIDRYRLCFHDLAHSFHHDGGVYPLLPVHQCQNETACHRHEDHCGLVSPCSSSGHRPAPTESGSRINGHLSTGCRPALRMLRFGVP